MSYKPNLWRINDIISALKLNHIEDGIKDIDSNINAIEEQELKNKNNIASLKQTLGPISAVTTVADELGKIASQIFSLERKIGDTSTNNSLAWTDDQLKSLINQLSVSTGINLQNPPLVSLSTQIAAKADATAVNDLIQTADELMQTVNDLIDARPSTTTDTEQLALDLYGINVTAFKDETGNNVQKSNPGQAVRAQIHQFIHIGPDAPYDAVASTETEYPNTKLVTGMRDDFECNQIWFNTSEESSTQIEIPTMEDFNSVIGEDVVGYITPNISGKVASNSIFCKEENNKLIMYGTCTSNRRILCLNGNELYSATTNTPFTKTFEAGTYTFTISSSEERSDIRFDYTYTTFNSDGWNQSNTILATETPITITFSAPVMMGMWVTTNTTYGTEETPLEINFQAVGNVAKDTVRYTPQNLSEEKKEQARKNIDVVSKEEFENSLSEITYKLPNYWQQYFDGNINNNFSLEKLQKKLEQTSLEGDSFIFFTDYYYNNNTNYSPSIMKLISDKCGISKILFGGNLINYFINETDPSLWPNEESGKELVLKNINNALEYFSPILEKLYCIAGNQEHYKILTNNEQEEALITRNYDPGIAVLYQILSKRKELEYGWTDAYGNYWFDNKLRKIRYFMISCDMDAKVTLNSATSVIAELANIPNDYTVVLVTHAAIHKEPEENIYEENTPEDGYIRTILNQLFNDHNDQTKYNVACVLTGHNFSDIELLMPATSNQQTFPVIAIASDAYSLDNSSTRTAGTISEQAFDIVQINTELHTVTLYRIGAISNDHNRERTFNYLSD